MQYCTQNSRAVMEKLQRADEAKREAAAAKNELESYILATRARVLDDEVVAAVSTEKQRTAFAAQLDNAEDWLYEDGEHAPAAESRRERQTEFA